MVEGVRPAVHDTISGHAKDFRRFSGVSSRRNAAFASKVDGACGGGRGSPMASQREPHGAEEGPQERTDGLGQGRDLYFVNKLDCSKTDSPLRLGFERYLDITKSFSIPRI